MRVADWIASDDASFLMAHLNLYFLPCCLQLGTHPTLSFSDGAALWADKLGQHLLHERHSAVSALCARAQNCSQKVGFSATIVLYCNYICYTGLYFNGLLSLLLVLNCFCGFAPAEIICLPLQVLRCSAIFRGKCTITVHHSRYEA